jgi:hypothetical protein
MRDSAIAAHSTCQPGRTERRGPAGLAGALRPPHQRIELVALARPVRIAPTLGEQPQHGVAVIARLVAELRGGVGAVVHVGVLGVVDDVGGPGRQHLLHQLDDLADGLRRRHVVVRRQHPQRRHVLPEQVGFAVGQLAPVHAVARGPLEQGIVDVGDVLHVVHAVSGVQPHPVDQVERQVGGGVAEVGGVVGGDAADVHGGRVARADRADLAVGAVVEPQLRTVPGQRRHGRGRPRVHGLDFRCCVRAPFRWCVWWACRDQRFRYADQMPSSNTSASSARHINRSGR